MKTRLSAILTIGILFTCILQSFAGELNTVENVFDTPDGIVIQKGSAIPVEYVNQVKTKELVPK